jgi:ubiquitin-protein ligase
MELKKLIAQPKTFGAVLKMNLDKPARWVLVLHGPKDSIYEGQNFHATI